MFAASLFSQFLSIPHLNTDWNIPRSTNNFGGDDKRIQKFHENKVKSLDFYLETIVL